MEILSRQESPGIAREADRLCRIIEERETALREGRAGKTAKVENAAFQLLQIGRNAVYRIDDARRWFLKLPCGKNWKGLEGEALGFRFLKTVFPGAEYYLHPAAVRISLKKGYILSAEVPGSQLNYHLYRGCFRASAKDFKKVEEMFRRCGRVLGEFHRAGANYPARPLASGLANTLERRLAKAERLDARGQEIARWRQTRAPFAAEESFVHGNCTYRNIFVHGDQAGLIDFETSGRGSLYNDLARVCSDVLLTRTALFFPWKRAFSALAALLEGYKSAYSYQPEHLLNYIALYIFDRYIQVYGIKKERETVSGVPVSRGKVHRLIDSLLEGDAASVFGGIRL